jgi:hypothetical protein
MNEPLNPLTTQRNNKNEKRTSKMLTIPSISLCKTPCHLVEEEEKFQLVMCPLNTVDILEDGLRYKLRLSYCYALLVRE